MVKVKVCGIRRLRDALAAVASGCDALGFVFYRKSPRYVSPAHARRIARLIPSRIARVGVFVNAREKTVRRAARSVGLDMLQFHGEETPEYCARFRGHKVIKAFRVRKALTPQDVLRYRTYAWLFDTFSRDAQGGTGRAFDRRLLREVLSLRKRRPLFLSGGLSKDNVAAAIKEVRPQWVDVSSAVESSPGKKDYAKLKEFVRAAKSRG